MQGSKTSRQGSISINTRSLKLDPAPTCTRLVYTGPLVQHWRHPAKAPSEKPCTRLVWTGPTASRFEGLQARLNLKKHKKPPARPSPNLAPAWSSQVQTKKGVRSEFERTLNSQRSRQGWSASGGELMQVRVRAWVLPAPGHPLPETP